jgi:hypothetical protein
MLTAHWLGSFAHKGPLRSEQVIRKTRNAWQKALKRAGLRTEFDLSTHPRPGRVRVELELGYRWGKGDLWISARVERQEGPGRWLAFSSTTAATRFDADVQLVDGRTPFTVVQKVSEAVAEARRSNDVAAERELTDVAARLWNIKLAVGIAASLLIAATAGGIAWYLMHRSSDTTPRETVLQSTTARASVDVRSRRQRRMYADVTTLASGWGLGNPDCEDGKVYNSIRLFDPVRFPVHVLRNNQLVHTFRTAEEAKTGYDDSPGSNRLATYKLAYATEDGLLTNVSH